MNWIYVPIDFYCIGFHKLLHTPLLVVSRTFLLWFFRSKISKNSKKKKNKWKWGAKTVIGPPLSLFLHPWLHWKLMNLQWGMSYLQALSSSISSRVGFGTHHYQSFLRGRGFLFANLQLMANEESSRLVRAYASNGWLVFRMDFAQVMLKMSGLNVLTRSQGLVQRNYSMALVSF